MRHVLFWGVFYFVYLKTTSYVSSGGREIILYLKNLNYKQDMFDLFEMFGLFWDNELYLVFGMKFVQNGDAYHETTSYVSLGGMEIFCI